MKAKASENAHRGSDFRDFLAGEGILPEVEVLALKRMILGHGKILFTSVVVIDYGCSHVRNCTYFGVGMEGDGGGMG